MNNSKQLSINNLFIYSTNWLMHKVGLTLLWKLVGSWKFWRRQNMSRWKELPLFMWSGFFKNVLPCATKMLWDEMNQKEWQVYHGHWTLTFTSLIPTKPVKATSSLTVVLIKKILPFVCHGYLITPTNFVNHRSGTFRRGNKVRVSFPEEKHLRLN